MDYSKLTKRELIEILRLKDKPVIITEPKDVEDYLKPYAKEKQEHAIVLCMNSVARVEMARVISKGTDEETFINPKDVFAPALENKSHGIIIAHNHPNGIVVPSIDDLYITNQIYEAGKILGIKVLDSIIFYDDVFYSIMKDCKGWKKVMDFEKHQGELYDRAFRKFSRNLKEDLAKNA